MTMEEPDRAQEVENRLSSRIEALHKKMDQLLQKDLQDEARLDKPEETAPPEATGHHPEKSSVSFSG